MNDIKKQLIRNSIITPDGTVLISKSRHDYVTYTDKNGKQYMVDGGFDYQRRSAHGDEVDNCLYDDQPHEMQRVILTWGTRGKDGTQPLKFIPIAEMTTDHIEAVLETQKNIRPVIKQCMINELKQRESK